MYSSDREENCCSPADMFGHREKESRSGSYYQRHLVVISRAEWSESRTTTTFQYRLRHLCRRRRRRETYKGYCLGGKAEKTKQKRTLFDSLAHNIAFPAVLCSCVGIANNGITQTRRLPLNHFWVEGREERKRNCSRGSTALPVPWLSHLVSIWLLKTRSPHLWLLSNRGRQQHCRATEPKLCRRMEAP